jgi:hypothetical protein
VPLPTPLPTPLPVTVILSELHNDQYDFAVGLPSQWDVYGLQTTLVQAWSPGRDALLYIKLIPYPNPFFNISSYTDLWLESLRAESEQFTELGRARFALNGLPAMEVLYTYRVGGDVYRGRAIFILAATMAFFVDGIALESGWPSQDGVLYAILHSFRPGSSYFPPANP